MSCGDADRGVKRVILREDLELCGQHIDDGTSFMKEWGVGLRHALCRIKEYLTYVHLKFI